MANEKFPLGFEWDPQKNRSNIEKHGIDFKDAVKAFERSTLDRVDDRQNYGEQRFNSVGDMGRDRTIVVNITHTERNTKTRIISARPATTKEEQLYRTQVLQQQQSLEHKTEQENAPSQNVPKSPEKTPDSPQRETYLERMRRLNPMTDAEIAQRERDLVAQREKERQQDNSRGMEKR